MDSKELQAILQRALAGDPAAQCELVDLLTPVIQKRVARALLKYCQGPSGARNVHQEAGDLTQEVFFYLLAKDARVLRRWDPELGLSLLNFVGLVAERRALWILRGRLSPWIDEPTLIEELPDQPYSGDNPERAASSREILRLLLDQLKDRLSAEGWHMFDLLFRQELSPAEVAQRTGKSLAAVYKWQSRLSQLARRILAELSNSDGEPQNP